VPAEPYALLIEGRTIAAVAPQRELACPPDTELIDARGMTVMPGLIDCHDHVTL
jgi:imidazolonepropionase-like amidohydrolase